MKNRLAKLMFNRGINEKRLHEETGIHMAIIRDLYANNLEVISFDVLEKLCMFFGITLNEFFEEPKKLKECPFCGSNAKFVQDFHNIWWVQCRGCSTTSKGSFIKKEVMELWNKRAGEL